MGETKGFDKLPPAAGRQPEREDIIRSLCLPPRSLRACRRAARSRPEGLQLLKVCSYVNLPPAAGRQPEREAPEMVGAQHPPKRMLRPWCGVRGATPYLMWMPEMARAMTRRWISDVPSKIV